MRQVWWNGELIPEAEARLSIYDSSLMFGDMVFEMTRSFNREHFKLTEHIERLMAGLTMYRIPLDMTVPDIIAACDAVSEATAPLLEPGDEHRLLIGVTRGHLPLYSAAEGYHGAPNLFVADFPLSWTLKGLGKYVERGVDVFVPSQRALPAHLLDPKVKSRSRAHYMMASQEAKLAGDYFPVLLGEDGYITEGPGYNIFFVKNGRLFTPRHGVLRGITRQFIIDRLDNDSYPHTVEERDVDMFDATTADGAFITATPFCALPVKSFMGVEYLIQNPCQGLLRKWSDIVRFDIAAQTMILGAGEIEGMTPYGAK